jgi:hypothetical protein
VLGRSRSVRAALSGSISWLAGSKVLPALASMMIGSASRNGEAEDGAAGDGA